MLFEQGNNIGIVATQFCLSSLMDFGTLELVVDKLIYVEGQRFDSHSIFSLKVIHINKLLLDLIGHQFRKPIFPTKFLSFDFIFLIQVV